ncbi:MOSC N-terminal beta barrel domain-containing protein [Streptomyces sp. NPDC091212]|uniref:MOSC domain-containing protein n=1 Tax=Streptomyces sp. NPDC091212 TaxID=3155191 RepID=UPI0034417005
MYVAMVRHYPVKSMLGGSLPAARLGPGGVEHDRALAVLDTGTGLVATAKHPRLWRGLLAFTATVRGDDVLITSPQGWSAEAGDPRIDGLLSDALGRSVRLTRDRPSAASVERTDPEDVLALGVDARVAAPTLRIGQGSPGSTFVDYAPVHVITTATLEHVGAELVRYRPNIVVETPPGTPAFAENDWVGKELRIGRERPVVLRVTLPTPRCAVPTLEHGPLPRAPHAVRTLMTANRVDVPGFGVLPCAGGYAEVVHSGVIRTRDRVALH